jgi:hypothetical protein
MRTSTIHQNIIHVQPHNLRNAETATGRQPENGIVQPVRGVSSFSAKIGKDGSDFVAG